MKQIKEYIAEKFQITKNSKIMCYPKNKSELRKILEERLAKDKNADLNNIDVSQIADMCSLFEDLDPHNIKIDQWDVSNVKDMSGMFSGCKNFNCDLSNWNVSNVNNMYYMFNGCDSLKNKPSWYHE